MDIVVKGRNVEVPDHYRQHVAEKLSRLERYDHKLIRIDVELLHEPNPRQSQFCQRVEITCTSRGPVIRSEAGAADFYSALDAAIAKVENRLRRAADRRKVHHGRRTPISVAAATAGAGPFEAFPDGTGGNGPGAVAVDTLEDAGDGFPDGSGGGGAGAAGVDLEDRLPGRIVRTKQHSAKPMTVEDALFQMELVGHDFYLFSDVDTGRPSVVYRRTGYDYGVISLSD